MRLNASDIIALKNKGIKIHGEIPTDLLWDIENPLEDTEAEVLARWLYTMLVVEWSWSWILEFSHIPNETRTPYKSVRAKLKRMWVRKGVPDYLISIQNSKNEVTVIFIELKRKKKSTTSQEQKKWIRLLNLAHIPAKVCKAHADAIQFISSFF